MAHRKLFSTSPEGSPDCTIYFCDRSCLNYPCLLFPPINNSVFISPPPPSPHQSISPFIIALVSVLTIMFVMAFRCALYRNTPNSNSLSNQTDNPNPSSNPNPNLGEDHHLNQNLSPRELEPVLIKSIKPYKYTKSKGSIHGADFSVCLGEFEEDEILWKLPKCSHSFHINCIDIWLSSHANCPLCCAPIVLATSPSMFAVGQTVGNLSADEEIKMRIREVNNDEPIENRGETSHENGEKCKLNGFDIGASKD